MLDFLRGNTAVMFGLSLVSMIGCGTVLLTYYIKHLYITLLVKEINDREKQPNTLSVKDVTTHNFRLIGKISYRDDMVLFVFISHFFTSLGSLMGEPLPDSIACWFEGIMTNWFTLSSCCWIVFMSYQLYAVIVQNTIVHVVSWMHVVAWVAPLFVTLLPLAHMTYNPPPQFYLDETISTTISDVTNYDEPHDDDRIGWCWIVNHSIDIITTHDNNNNTSPQLPWSASFWFWWSFYGWMVIGLTMALVMIGSACWSFYRSDAVTKESNKRFCVIYSKFKWYAPVMVCGWLGSFIFDFQWYLNSYPSSLSNMYALTVARTLVSVFACSVGWLSTFVYWLTHLPEIRTVWMAYFEKLYAKPLSHYIEETDSDNEMMMRILQGGEQMGIGGQEGKENDGINAYLGTAGGTGLAGQKKMANMIMVSDLKAMLAAQFESESKKYNAAQSHHNQNEIVVENVEDDRSIKVNQALYPSLGGKESQSKPTPQIGGGGGGVEGVVAGGGGNGGSNQVPTKGHQRVVLRGSRGSRDSKRKANKRLSMENIANAFSIRRVSAFAAHLTNMEKSPHASGGDPNSAHRVGPSPHATLRFHAGGVIREHHHHSDHHSGGVDNHGLPVSSHDNSRYAQFEAGLGDQFSMASKFSQNNSQSIFGMSPSGKPGNGFLLHGLEGVLDDLAQTEEETKVAQQLLLMSSKKQDDEIHHMLNIMSSDALQMMAMEQGLGLAQGTGLDRISEHGLGSGKALGSGHGSIPDSLLSGGVGSSGDDSGHGSSSGVGSSVLGGSVAMASFRGSFSRSSAAGRCFDQALSFQGQMTQGASHKSKGSDHGSARLSPIQTQTSQQPLDQDQPSSSSTNTSMLVSSTSSQVQFLKTKQTSGFDMGNLAVPNPYHQYALGRHSTRAVEAGWSMKKKSDLSSLNSSSSAPSSDKDGGMEKNNEVGTKLDKLALDQNTRMVKARRAASKKAAAATAAVKAAMLAADLVQEEEKKELEKETLASRKEIMSARQGFKDKFSEMNSSRGKGTVFDKDKGVSSLGSGRSQGQGLAQGMTLAPVNMPIRQDISTAVGVGVVGADGTMETPDVTGTGSTRLARGSFGLISGLDRVRRATMDFIVSKPLRRPTIQIHIAGDTPEVGVIHIDQNQPSVSTNANNNVDRSNRRNRESNRKVSTIRQIPSLLHEVLQNPAGGGGVGSPTTPILRRPSSMLALSNFMTKDPITPHDQPPPSGRGDKDNNARSSPVPMLTEEELLRQKGIDYLKMMAQRDEDESRKTTHELMMSSQNLGPLSGKIPNSHTNLSMLSARGNNDKGMPRPVTMAAFPAYPTTAPHRSSMPTPRSAPLSSNKQTTNTEMIVTKTTTTEMTVTTADATTTIPAGTTSILSVAPQKSSLPTQRSTPFVTAQSTMTKIESGSERGETGPRREVQPITKIELGHP